MEFKKSRKKYNVIQMKCKNNKKNVYMDKVVM